MYIGYTPQLLESDSTLQGYAHNSIKSPGLKEGERERNKNTPVCTLKFRCAKTWSGRGNAVLHTNFVGRRTNAPAVVGPLATPSGDIGETVNDKDKKKTKQYVEFKSHSWEIG